MENTIGSDQKVNLVWITPNAESMIAEIARVSSPDNQKNPEYVGLVKYLIKHEHWSPFEMASFCVKIKTSRAISAQLIRHRSFVFQELSQRYSEVTEFEPIETRKQAIKNRQSSLEVFDPVIDTVYHECNTIPPYALHASTAIAEHIRFTHVLYTQLLRAGIAKESARFILPLTTQTTLYMTGSIRSWIHYTELRTKDDVQKEHREVALQIQGIFNGELPLIATALAELHNEASLKELLFDKYKKGEIVL